MHLPSLSREPLPPGRAAVLEGLTSVEHGFVHTKAAAGRELFLFVREGRAWCAGTQENGSLGALSVSEFVRAADSFEEAFLCRTDLPLFLCTAVLFRKAPAAHVPAALVDGEALLKSLRALGKDAVLAVQRRDVWSLAFCRSGEPVALYGAPELDPRSSVQDRLMELIYAAPNEVTIDLYDEIRLPPAADAGQPIHALASSLAADAPMPTVVVLLGDRVVFRHRLDRAETVVGRGLEADLALDNLSVSRRHAVIRVIADELVVEDLGSENGLSLNGERVERAVLQRGDRVGIGKYTIAYALHVESELPPQPRKRPASADIKTVALSARGAVLEHRGQRHRVSSIVFTIGSSSEAHLRIRGLFVAPVHAVLQVEGDSYRVDHSGGLRSVRVNGKQTKRACLADGDELVIAGEKMRFRLA